MRLLMRSPKSFVLEKDYDDEISEHFFCFRRGWLRVRPQKIYVVEEVSIDAISEHFCFGGGELWRWRSHASFTSEKTGSNSGVLKEDITDDVCLRREGFWWWHLITFVFLRRPILMMRSHFFFVLKEEDSDEISANWCSGKGGALITFLFRRRIQIRSRSILAWEEEDTDDEISKHLW